MNRADILNKSFASLLPAQQQELGALLRPDAEGFTDEQQALMRDLWFWVPDDQLPQIDILNAQWPFNKIGVISTVDGRSLLPVSLLTDTRPGETYAHAREFLAGLAIVEVLPEEFNQEVIPNGSI